MAGYSGKPVVQKLGIKPGFRIFVGHARRRNGDIVGKRASEPLAFDHFQLLLFHSGMVMISGLWP